MLMHGLQLVAESGIVSLLAVIYVFGIIIVSHPLSPSKVTATDRLCCTEERVQAEEARRPELANV